MKRPRPQIPLSVKLMVTERQIRERGLVPLYASAQRQRLKANLLALFGDQQVHLDHDPALINRKFNWRTGKYTPDANNPYFLIYRTKQDHDIKTRVRGDGAQHSDLALRRKNKRIARNRDPNRRKAKIAQRKRAWPKRKFARRK